MERMSQAEENRLVKSTQRAIAYTKKGMSPNDAIQKVATEEDYSPAFIERIAQGFNKAKSVHMLKEAGQDTRANSFSLADSSEIIKSLYSVEKTAADSFSLPGNISHLGFSEKIEKAASDVCPTADPKPSLSSGSYLRKYKQHAGFMNSMAKEARQEAATHRLKMMESFQKAADCVQRMHPSAFEKIARLVVNSYGEDTGNNMLRVIGGLSRQDLPEMTKTANAAIFPSTQPYAYIQDAYNSAHALADAQQWVKHVEKEANLATSFLANFAADAVAKPLGGAEKALAPEVDEELDAEHFNRAKALEAKRALYSMINSEDFAPYKHAEIVGAWNRLADEHPKAMMEQPSAARALMLQNLEGGANRDLHEISQIQKVENQ